MLFPFLGYIVTGEHIGLAHFLGCNAVEEDLGLFVGPTPMIANEANTAGDCGAVPDAVVIGRVVARAVLVATAAAFESGNGGMCGENDESKQDKVAGHFFAD